MTERSSRLAATVERQHRELVELVASASEQQLGAPCDDNGGGTVGEVADHCAEGYEMAAVWLRRGAGEVSAPAAAHAHPHPHPRDHDHDHGHANGHEPVAVAERLRRSGEDIVALVRELTNEQLDAVPPASVLADGRSPLETVFGALVAHLQEHLDHMRSAAAAVP